MSLPRFIPLPPGYRFEHDRGMLALPPGLEPAARRTLAVGNRHDGEIITVKTIGPEALVATSARYAHFLAERETGGERAVRPLAVIGLTRVAGKWLFGHRCRDVLQDSGALELAPSGGMEAGRIGASGTIDYAAQLLAELEEECGIIPGPARVSAIGLIDDAAEAVVDIACLLELDCTEAELRTAHRENGSGEYDSLFLASSEEVANWRDWPEPVGRASVAILSTVDLAMLCHR